MRDELTVNRGAMGRLGYEATKTREGAKRKGRRADFVIFELCELRGLCASMIRNVPA
jgi:hypothetical protein